MLLARASLAIEEEPAKLPDAAFPFRVKQDACIAGASSFPDSANVPAKSRSRPVEEEHRHQVEEAGDRDAVLCHCS